MKTVFNSREVCHVWAQQKQAHGKSNSIFFDGPTIFSYGHHFPMARFSKDPAGNEVVLFTTRSYSVTTSKHLRYAQNAISHKEVIYVHDVLDSDQTANAVHMLDLLEDLRLATIKARVSKPRRMVELQDGINALEAFLKRFKVKFGGDTLKRWKTFQGKTLVTEEMETAYKEQRKKELAAEKERVRKLAAENAEKIEAWKRGDKDAYFPGSFSSPVVLRLHKREEEDGIETSRGAWIPLVVARKVWKRIKAGADLSGLNLGHYTVTRFDNDSLVAGCHVIPRSEINRMAAVLKWE